MGFLNCFSTPSTSNNSSHQRKEENSPLIPKLWPQLKLENSGLHFKRSQLARLNLHLSALLHADTLGGEQGASIERARGAVEQAVERLVQRLICSVGELDSRFSSKFLITFESKTDRVLQTEWPGRRFKYLVRLDCLSWPSLYPNDKDNDNNDNSPCFAVEGDEAGALPAGWIRVKPCQGMNAQTWAEFLAPSGCLRRDRIVEKFANLLSEAATISSDTEIDESRLCGAPGKVLDAGLLDVILSEVTPENQLFYGPSEAQRCRPTDPRDFKLAVVHEGGSGPILLRVGLLSPSLQAALPNQDLPPVIEVKLHIGIGLGGWINDPDSYPTRLPINHPLALLAYKSAQNGYYAMAVSPPNSLRCEERRSAWKVCFPATEIQIDTHFSSVSTSRRVLSALRLLIYQMEPRDDGINEDEIENHQGGLKTVRDCVLRTLVKKQQEKYVSMDAWEPASLAAHVLLSLDTLLASLRTRHISNFFIPDVNLLILPSQLFINSDTITQQDPEEEWEMAICEDSHAVYDCLARLYGATRQTSDDNIGSFHAEWGIGSEDEQRCAALEAALLTRWKSALNTISPSPPPTTTKKSSSSFLSRPNHNSTTLKPQHFSPRQLDYIAQVVRELIKFRRSILQHQGQQQQQQSIMNNDILLDQIEEPTEDFLFLLDVILEQALGTTIYSKNKKSSLKGRHRKTRKDFDKRQAWRDSITEAVRRESLPQSDSNINEEITLVRYLLQWLWCATNSAPKNLRMRLIIFLENIWYSSRENTWHLPEWRNRYEEVSNEMKALAAFCKMLLASQEGWTGVAVLKDAADKGWRWARSAQAELTRCGSLQLVLTPSLGVVRRCDVALALQPSTSSSRNSNAIGDRSKTLPARHQHYRQPNISQEELTVKLGRGILTTTNWQETVGPSHLRLRDGSPLTAAFDSRRRYGQQHALGNLVNAFIAMHRISVLQEVAALLPSSERQPVLDALQRLSRSRRLNKTREQPEINNSNGRYTQYNTELSIKIPSKSSAITTSPVSVSSASSETESTTIINNDILGTCRAARKLQRRHTLFYSFPSDIASIINSTSPTSVRRRYNLDRGGTSRPNISLLQLGDAGEITLQTTQQDDEVHNYKTDTLTKF